MKSDETGKVHWKLKDTIRHERFDSASKAREKLTKSDDVKIRIRRRENGAYFELKVWEKDS